MRERIMVVATMSTNRVLPMVYPPITSYPSHANLLSVLLGHEKALPWIHNHYIQLYGVRKDKEVPWFDFYATGTHWNLCPWIEEFRIGRALIDRKWTSFTEFIVDCVETGYYVCATVDRFFVPGHRSYQRSHVAHEIFIFGFDLENQNVDVADFFANGKYEYRKATFGQIEQGFRGVSASYSPCGDDDTWDYLRGADMLCPTDFLEEVGGGYSFDIEQLKMLLDDYLHSRNTFAPMWSCIPQVAVVHNSVETVYGLNCYNLLREFLEDCVGDGVYHIDIRPFHLLWDHKKAMLMRIEYLGTNNILRDARGIYQRYKAIERESLINRNLALKCLITGDRGILTRIDERLRRIVEKERSVLRLLLRNLAKSQHLV